MSDYAYTPNSGNQAGEDVAGLLRQALELVRRAALAEPDDIDQAKIEDIGTKIAGCLAEQQKTMDTVMGGGPAAKLMRKLG
jgi:hypothetical protein